MDDGNFVDYFPLMAPFLFFTSRTEGSQMEKPLGCFHHMNGLNMTYIYDIFGTSLIICNFLDFQNLHFIYLAPPLASS